jgi:tRNA 2-thiocytidine biosynthesis protein TtcA
MATQEYSPLARKLMHYTRKALFEYQMIQKGDRIMVCLSGGKDSYTMLWVLAALKKKYRLDYELFSFTLDQVQPGWNDSGLRAWLDSMKIPYEILKRDTYSIVTEKIPEGKTYCSLCSRLRRGNIYGYAEQHGFKKIALGHHRDDMISTVLMSMLYSGSIKSMPPKLLTDNQKHIVIRPLMFCQEADIAAFAQEMQFPIIPCTLCGSQENLKRKQVKTLIDNLAKDNPKVPSNLLHALQALEPSQLADHRHWNFKGLSLPEDSLDDPAKMLEEVIEEEEFEE